MDLPELVDSCYQSRVQAWESARIQLMNWLRQQCREALLDGDHTRLEVPSGRIKDQDRAVQKLSRVLSEDPELVIDTWNDVEEHLRDLVGLKVLCKSTRDQQLIVDYLKNTHAVSGIEMGADIKDYATCPKETGYRAIHLHYSVDVAGYDEPVLIEVQVRTRLQDAWGELTHEDLYKPGGGLKATRFHGSVAKTIADLLAVVDGLADDLACEIEATLQNAPEDAEPGDAVADDVKTLDAVWATVRTTGPRYALADDENGRRGLIPAYAVRDLVGGGYIRVHDYLKPEDEIRVRVVDNDEGVFYLPLRLPN